MAARARTAVPAGLAGSAWSVLLALFLCASAFGRGTLLYRDFVSVPDPAIGPGTLGLDGQPPRAVPLDLVAAVLNPVLPTWLQQQALLAASVALAGCGVAVLLRHHGPAAAVVGATLATWNPFVASRLLLGQPPTLLGYAMIPWLVLAVRSRLTPGRRVAAVLAAAAPAALTPWGGVAAAVVVLLTALWGVPHRSRQWVAGYAVLSALWCSPWVVAALASSSGVGDPDGATAFAVAADSWAGRVGSVLTLGGVWAPAARLASRQDVWPVLGSFVVLALALWGLRAVLRDRPAREANLLAAAWLAPPALALALSAGPGLALFRALQPVPGFALVRDTHRLLGFSAVAASVLAALGAAELARRVPSRVGPAPRVLVPVVVVSLALLTAPDLGSRLHAAYRPVSYPKEWHEVTSVLADTAGTGSVLVLPWQPFRRVGWVGRDPFLDPLPRALPTTVLSSHDLTVPRDGAVLTVAGGDPPEGGAWARGVVDPETLDRLGITAVVEWKGTPGVLPRSHPGLRVVHDGRWFTVWSRSSDADPADTSEVATGRPTIG